MGRGVARRGTSRAWSRPAQRCGAFVGSAIVVGLLASCAGAPEPDPSASDGASRDGFPVTIDNCGRQVTLEEPPGRAVMMNHAATEMVLALDLADRVAGTSSRQPVPERWKEAYDSIEVLAEEYPSQEVFLSAEPDFAIATEHSAFTSKDVGTRDELADQGIPTYRSSFQCSKEEDRAKSSFPAAWAEITDIGRLFGVPERAERLVERQRQTMDRLQDLSPGEGISVFWYDMHTKSPIVGAGGGGPQVILGATGARNIFGHINDDFEVVSWEKVVAADPDVIVLADWSSSSAQEKIEFLESDPALSQLTAVKNRRYVTVPSQMTLSRVRLVEGAQTVAEGLAEYDELGTR
ncbi:ABC transporter substrate-binding protein [Janibacter cremeus]|uniref:Iron complex transport system substrate-binding protein n=1 Tax=Janibacter cremeus TaxID=1285192 RepID=A0A852VX70_9MICO|nr:ABC transporter substrate-binding protein [Janibacter cremeus]NYF98375.1 iron complex transport system substrate-binding protein [Janibacter cremeus]